MYFNVSRNDELHLASCIVPATTACVLHFSDLFYIQGINLLCSHRIQINSVQLSSKQFNWNGSHEPVTGPILNQLSLVS